jgi:hypothetical protein
MHGRARTAIMAAALLSLLGACAGTGSTAGAGTPSSDESSAQTHDGLVLKPGTRADEVYVRPGATLSGYRQYGLEPCQVAFRKNWMRDQNRDSIDLSSRVTQKDVDKIRDSLGAACDRYFRDALQQPSAYALAESFDQGEAVLVIRPSIVNLDITAPDIMSAGNSRSYTTSAGEMTLYLELLDGTTGEILVRVVDRQRALDTGTLQWSNGVTNRAEADRMLKRWAGELREALDSATGT